MNQKIKHYATAPSMSVEKKIEAVEFLLASFFGNPKETERERSIAEKAATNEHIKTYGRFSENKLQDQLTALQKQLNGE